jgi:hypothetical protein
MLIKISLYLSILIMLISCASRSDDSSEKGAFMFKEFTDCIEARNSFSGPAIKRKTADCAIGFYNNINRLIPDTDRFKPAGLNMARKMFILLTDYDNGKIADQKTMRQEALKINNEMKAEADEIATMVATERAIQSERRRRMFIEAQNFMRSTTPGYGSTVKTCTPSPGAPTGTLVCN